MESVITSRVARSLTQRARIARVIVASAFAALFIAGCSSSTDFSPITSLTVSPASATLAPGGTQQFTVVTKDGNGTTITGTRPTWSVVAGGGTISSTGLFTAGTTAGTFTNTVAVTCSGITSFATVIVTAGPLTTITVTPNPGTMPVNTSLQYTAVGKDANGNVVAITPVWSVAAGGGAINSGTGLFTAGGTPGTYTNTVVATSGSISGNATAIVTAGAVATIVVTPNPVTLQINTTQQFTAVARDAAGNVVPITPVWTVTNGGGAINSGSGLFTAGGTAGSFPNTVRATSGSIFGTATVNVTTTPPPPPAPFVDLGAATTMGILAGSTITCVTGGTINADIGLSPGGAVVLGTPPCVVTGTQHITDATAAQAQSDLTAAYNTLVGLPCGTVVGTADIGNSTRAPGVYCSGSTIGVTGTLTLDALGDPNAVWVFQAGSGLTGVGTIALINGAQAKNVYWQVGSSASIGTGSNWKGNILSLASITLNDNVTLIGRALARSAGAVTLGTGDTITLP